MANGPHPALLREQALARGLPPALLNPVYAALALPTGDARPGHALAEAPAPLRDLAVALLCAPAVLTIAAAEPGGDRALRIGLTPSRTILDSPLSHPTPTETTSYLPLAADDIVPTVADFLPDGPLSAPPHLTQESAAARRHRTDDESPARAEAESARTRVSMTLMLSPASLGMPGEPIGFSRVWAEGANGLVRMDVPTGGSRVPAPVDVEPGDVLGTLLPLLTEGQRFVAQGTASRSGNAR